MMVCNLFIMKINNEVSVSRGFWMKQNMISFSTSLMSVSNLKLYPNYSLKVPERYEKWLQVSSSVKGKSLAIPPSGRKWATS